MTWTDAFLTFVPLFFAIVLHEIAHGYVALLLGDGTAKHYGRLSLNPFKHIDLLGTIIIPAFLAIGHAPFIFGWAKPVPVNPRFLRNRPRDEILVAAAGIAMNLWLAVVSALLLLLAAFITAPYLRGVVSLFLFNMVVFNVGLAVFNAIPIPPLDGARILLGWIKAPWAKRYLNYYSYGLIIMVFLLFILPAIGDSLGVDLNLVRNYMISVTRYICSFLL